jgi:hypothetical protein
VAVTLWASGLDDAIDSLLPVGLGAHSSASQCVPVDFALVQLLSLCGVSYLQVKVGIVLESPD